MDDIKGIRTLVLDEADPAVLRERVRHYFHQTFSIDEKLYETLSDDSAFYLRADPLRHPLVFYMGHTAVFFINKLIISKVITQRINPAFESMFAVGVDEMSWDDLNEANYDWPPIPELRVYRDLVRDRIDRLISVLPLDEKGITWESPWWAIVMGIEHERIHLETSSVLIRQLPLDKVRQLDFWPLCERSGDIPLNDMIAVAAGQVTIGRDDSLPLYGWDNEYGKAVYEVPPFKASRFLVSNAEYLSFVHEGGYDKPEYWTEEGWAWKSYQKAKMPRFWRLQADGSHRLRTMASEIPMPWDWPVEVNYLEAKAFCNWKKAQTGRPVRLPSEEEWYRLRDLHVHTDQHLWDKAPGNINLEHCASPCPVNRFAFGSFYDLIGNVWQWTETPIYALPGFKLHPIYDDFSVPTFDGRHNLIKGGSWISTGNEALRNSRYAFRRHFYQHAGFRYIESETEATLHDAVYEDDPAIIKHCASEWGKPPLGELDFHQMLMAVIEPYLAAKPPALALNIGCKTGRSAFELAKYADHVIGLDFTARLIRLGTEMKENGYIRFMQVDEGEIISYAEASLADHALEQYAHKVEFWQGDISNLVAKFSGYDLILSIGGIEEAINPIRFLQDIHTRLNPGGLLIIADSYDYDPQVTLPQNRVGGFRKDGEPFGSFEGVKELLSHHFEIVDEPLELTRCLRINQRRYDLRLVQVSVWRLK